MIFRSNNHKLSEITSVPPKPHSQKQQISMLWDAVYNHLPTQLRQLYDKQQWQDKKTTFVLVMLALVLAFLAVLIAKSG